MPLRGHRKREYQRRYMQQRRLAAGGESERGGLTGSFSHVYTKGEPVRPDWLDTESTYFTQHEDVRPTKGKELTKSKWLVKLPRVGLGRTKDAKWMRGYLGYLAACELTMVETFRGWELVGMATGEVGVYGRMGSALRPSALEQRILHLEQRLAAVELDQSIERANAVLEGHRRELEETWQLTRPRQGR